MKRLVVCCDGTWNTPDQEENMVVSPTNVYKIHNAIPDLALTDGIVQHKYYHSGVGADPSIINHYLGGAFGIGLDKIIMSAYKWLCTMYKTNDDIYLFGFSRGAFTVRSLGGMIAKCGLLDLEGIDDDTLWHLVNIAFYKGYRETGNNSWRRGIKFHPLPEGKDVCPIKCIGVWDTVGSLGIPDDNAILNLFDNAETYRFHNTELGKHVEYAMHAISVDEIRSSFSPTLWTNVQDRKNVEQRWFPGEHGDIGGGRFVHGLSDTTFAWMIAKAQEAGLEFNENMTSQIHPDFMAYSHNPLQGLWKYMRTQPRNIPLLDNKNNMVDDSVIARQNNPPIEIGSYQKTIQLAKGEKLTVPIFAKEHWNNTSLYCFSGQTYSISAQGQWVDSTITCGPRGICDGKFSLGEIVQKMGDVLGKLEKLFGKNADLFGTRRFENYNWMALVGVVANGENPCLDGTPAAHEDFFIGEACTLSPHNGSGYLYCFANDAWDFYWNNTGSVVITIERIA